MSDNACLVFDVGGTTTRMGVCRPGSETLFCLASIETPNFLNNPHLSQTQLQDALIDAMGDVARQSCGSSHVDRVAVAFAGPVSGSGEVMAAPTIWGSAAGPFAFAPALRRLWPAADIALLNDVTAAGYRHVRTGNECFCIVTVSSGIGNKIFIDGRPITGLLGRGGEIGHLRVDYGRTALPCDCGGEGHLGSIASGRGTLKLAQISARDQPESFCRSQAGLLAGGKPERLDTRAIAMAFADGDDWTLRIVRSTAAHLARALASLHVAIGLESFVIYGGFASALGERYRQLLARLAQDACWNTGQDWDEMIVLETDSDYLGLSGLVRYLALRADAKVMI